MRRSIGMRDAEPPQRLRSGGATGSNSRQSRSSVPSSGKRNPSLSRLPMPEIGKGKPSHRSSSHGGVGVLTERGRSSMTTPVNRGIQRSSSGNRSSDRLKNQQKADYLTPKRYSSASKVNLIGNSQRLSGRGSKIGAGGVKDTRPLGDKSFQQKNVRKILDFLRENEYTNNSLTSKHFPLSSKEFINVFNFIYSFIDPSNHTALPHSRFEEHIIKLLKSLHYPGNLSKSNFVTMGSLHSWPTVLGSLSFICDLASIYTQKLLPNIISLGFPSKDEMGFVTDQESNDKLSFDLNLECWAEFNNGADEYPEQMKQFQRSLLENNNVDLHKLEYLEQKKRAMEQEWQRLEGRASRKIELLEQKTILESDIDKMNAYLKNIESHNRKKQEDVMTLRREQEELKNKLDSLTSIVAEMRANCESRKVSQFEAEKNHALIMDRQATVQTARESYEATEKEMWQKEINLSREREKLDSLSKQINSLCLQEDIKTLTGENLTVQAASTLELSTSVRLELCEVARTARASTRNTERELQEVAVSSDQVAEEANIRRKEVYHKENELSRLDEDITNFKLFVESEEKCLDDQLRIVKDELHQLKSEQRVDTDKLRRELVSSETRLNQIQHQRKEDYLAGQKFLKHVADRTVTYLEDGTKYRDQVSRAMHDAVNKRLRDLKNSRKEIELRVTKAIEESKKKF